MRLRKFLSFLFTSVAAGLAAAFAVLMIKPQMLEPHNGGASTPAAPEQHTAAVFPTSGPVSYARAVARAAPSVVNIYTTKISAADQFEPGEVALQRQYFRRRHAPQRQDNRQNSLGSGVIVSPQDYLLTNNHIIEDAKQI